MCIRDSHGRVLDVNDKTVLIQVAKGELRVDLNGISADGTTDSEAMQSARS